MTTYPFRNRDSLTYRKKYKCPKCKSYSLIIIHDSEFACENGCEDSLCNNENEELLVNKIIDNNDYQGYYTRRVEL